MKLNQLHKSLWFWVILVHIAIFIGFYDLISKGLNSGITEEQETESNEQRTENREQRTENREQ